MSIAEDIKLAVERAARVPADYVETVPIIETFRGQVVWNGNVEVFTIRTLPPGKAYGWAVDGGKGSEYVAIVANPPIVSPLDAVRAWIVATNRG